MEIEPAAEMGLCFGVKRAITLAEEAVQKQELLESLGPIVHNKQVVDRFAAQGMRVIGTLEDVQGSNILIPSHGVGREITDRIEALGLNVVDATCPTVHNAQIVAQKLGQEGFRVLVFGDATHTEVKGLLSWAGGGAMAVTEVPKFVKIPKRIGILSQTTQSQAQFARFVTDFINSELASLSEIRIFNTICDATAKRQAAAINLASNVDLMLVIGGKNSANTKRLAELCSSTGVETRHIETAEEIDVDSLEKVRRIGITAGASTPDWVIREVMGKLEGV